MPLDWRALENSTLFKGLDQATLEDLAGLMRATSLGCGKILFSQDAPSNGCYTIVDGALKVASQSIDGEETLLAVCGPGDIIGEMGLIDNAPRSATLTALRKCQLGFLPTQDFRRFADRHPAVYRQMLKVLSLRLRASNEAFAAYQNLPLPGRLAHVLLRLVDGFGKPLDGKRVMIHQNITQADLGLMVGSARENVSRQINCWRRENVLSRISRYYCVEDAGALRKLARL